MVELKTSDSGHLKKIVTENEDVTEIEETGHETAGNEMVPAGKENQCEKIEDILVNNNGVWTCRVCEQASSSSTCRHILTPDPAASGPSQVRSRSGPGQVQVRSRTGPGKV